MKNCLYCNIQGYTICNQACERRSCLCNAFLIRKIAGGLKLVFIINSYIVKKIFISLTYHVRSCSSTREVSTEDDGYFF